MAVRQLFYVLFGDEHPVSCFYAGKRSFSLGNHIVMHFASLSRFLCKRENDASYVGLDMEPLAG
ncbi:hypothetical protein ACEF06_12660, partial [Brevibacillus agri]